MDEHVTVFLALETELHKQEQQLGIEFEQVQEQLERTLKTEEINKTETNEYRTNFFIGSCAQTPVISDVLVAKTNDKCSFVRFANKNEVFIEAIQRPLYFEGKNFQ
ncbi:13551_t:CDS:2 [Rhizophagus irregularis]|nr:13551_t:CDS:2 [Rhizophagus irregularis]